MNWKPAIKFAGVCWVAGIAAGGIAHLLVPGSGALVGSVTAISVAVVFIFRWKDALYSAMWLNHQKTHEVEAMALLAPKDDFTYLPWSVWALAPDALLRVIGFLRIHDWKTVVECGSGISTVILAKEFRARGAGHVYALEQDADWAILVRQLLEERGLSNWATVVDAPLSPMEVDAMTFKWYDPASIRDVLALPKVDALIVDGPKGDTGPLARYPAVPMLKERLGADFMVVLDDGHRTDEKEIARLWGERYGIGMSLRDTSRGQWECVRSS